MTKDIQEYLQEWEKINNPFYPNEMRWDRIKVNTFLKSYKEQLTLTDVSNLRELLIDFLDELKPSDYMELKFADIVDNYLKSKVN